MFEFLIIQACWQVIPQTNYSIAIIPWIRDLAIFFVACAGLFAGLPAPTGTAQCSNLQRSCGSGQAREEAGAGSINPPRPPAPESTARRP
ncbi:hypothetical protein D0O09_19275 [Pseudomonas putida]|nr:hypothetical protein D0O09_19275 [Pseudomonas putida]